MSRRCDAVGAALLVVAVLVGCQPSGRPATPKKSVAVTPVEREFYDVAYATESPRQSVDVYLPPSGRGPFPVIVFLHGGGFITGDKRDGQQQVALAARDRGYAVISANYRLLGDADFPAQIQDVKSVVQWVRLNKKAYAFDGTRIAVWGASAGGHLAALAGTTAGVRSLESTTAARPYRSDRVQAVVDWFGPVDIADMYEYLRTQPRSWDTTTQMRYLGEYLSSRPGLVRLANPLTHASPDDPPMLIEHGTDDHTVPLEQSERLADRMRLVIGPEKVELRVFEGAGHGGHQFTDPAHVTEVLDFLDEAMGIKRPPEARPMPQGAAVR